MSREKPHHCITPRHCEEGFSPTKQSSPVIPGLTRNLQAITPKPSSPLLSLLNFISANSDILGFEIFNVKIAGQARNDRAILYIIFCAVITLLFLTSCGSSYTPPPNAQPPIYHPQPEYPDLQPEQPAPPPAPLHPILHLPHYQFIHSIAHPRLFPHQPTTQISAGVVPHHNTAATLISGFFAHVAHSGDYDLVIILAPNHTGDIAGVVLSYRDWDIGDGVFTHREFVDSLHLAPQINTAICHHRMYQEHSASILIPYIHHYLPGTKVAPILLNRALSFNETIAIFDWLNDWIAAYRETGKNVLLIASIDFSHFLSVPESREKDAATKEAIFANDLMHLHAMNYHYLDSPAAMIIFLMYLDARGYAPKILAHTDASEFMSPGLGDTTSYMIIVGTKK